MTMAFKMVTGSLFGGGNKSKLEDQQAPEPVPVGQDFRPGQAQAESDGSRRAVEGLAKNMAKNSKEQRKQDIDSKIAEVKSQQMADSSLKSHLTPINSSLPSNLEHIYARSEEVGEQNKSIIELLNRANDIALDNNKVGKKAFDLEKAQVESRLRKSSDLYQILQKMKSESESANAELNNIKSEIGGSEKRIAMRNAADIARAMRDKFKARGGKSVGMLTLLSLGFIASVLNNTFDIIDDVRKKIVEGFEGVSEFLRNIGQSIGFIKEDTIPTFLLKPVKNALEASKFFISSSSLFSDGVLLLSSSSKSSVLSTFIPSKSVSGSAIPSSSLSSSSGFSFLRASAMLITVLGFDMVTTLSQPT